VNDNAEETVDGVEVTSCVLEINPEIGNDGPPAKTILPPTMLLVKSPEAQVIIPLGADVASPVICELYTTNVDGPIVAPAAGKTLTCLALWSPAILAT